MSRDKPQLLITVDCGTGSTEAVKKAQQAGLDVVVTDHHEPSGDVAKALAVVNPKLGKEESIKVLAGVGVAFKLCHALVKRGRDRKADIAGKMDLRNYLDYVSVGTIADVVPLQSENRILARHGLALLNKDPSLGLKILMEVAGVKDQVDAYHIGFIIGPRLNAAGRIGDARAALELLTTGDSDRAFEVARQLDAANRERQAIEQRMVQEADEEIKNFFNPARHFGLVVAKAGWHQGVVGIVAARLTQKYHRPAIVLTLDESGMASGSCRSIEDFNLVENLEKCAALLERFGGHAMAAGLEIKADRLESFKQRFNEVAGKALDRTDLRPVQKVDAWTTLAEADDRLLESIDKMRPFGLGNPTPVWAARALSVVGRPRVVGSKHLKMVLATEGIQRDAIAFGMAERKIPDGPVDVAFQLQRNTYQGRATLQLKIEDFRRTTR